MKTIDTLPKYLRQFCKPQDMSKYTAREHASWRYIMRRGIPFFRKHAVWVYEDGLEKTGLPKEEIPSVDFMDESLQRIGWGAVPIRGFIPTFAFLEFQARQILPIATDMRTMNHIGYTPAPDIVHEAAGHAPILPDKEYADYLSAYAKLCTKAIYSKGDLLLYEAIRALSDIKESPDARPEEIAALDAALKKVISEQTLLSEQAKVARMSWWTNEYGLVGDLDNPKIYGAGLLSSVEEAKGVYTERVKKLRLSIDCIKTSYDITQPQPQLYVAEDMQHLIDVCQELDKSLCFRIGGAYALKMAKGAETITTTVFSSGLEISGQVEAFETSEERVDFIKWRGPVQLYQAGSQLKSQGKERHPQGFSGPVGLFEGSTKDPSLLSDAELRDMGLSVGKRSSFKFQSGFKLEGVLQRICRSKNQKILYMTFQDCQLSRAGKVYYQPNWGPLDMPVAKSIPSVYGGPADRGAFGEVELKDVESTPARTTPLSSQEKKAMSLYGKIRELRSRGAQSQDYEAIGADLLENHPQEWLGLLEVQEKSPSAKVLKHLQSAAYPPEVQTLISEGLQIG